MARPGPKTLPTHLKLVTGNPGKRKLNSREPKPRGNLSKPPEWLTEDQKSGWEYALQNAPLGLLKLLDRGAFTVWVVAEDMHRQAAEKVAALGMLTKTTGGNIVQSPYLPIVNRQALIMLKAAGELGFTPAARPRIMHLDGQSGSRIENEKENASDYFD